MMDEAEDTKQVSPDIERAAMQKARDRANAGRWNLEVAIFSYAILIIIMILLFQGIRVEVAAPVSIFGLAMVWLMGWRRGRQLYQRYYDEELLNLEQESKKIVKETAEEAAEETIEERVRKALRERWR